MPLNEIEDYAKDIDEGFESEEAITPDMLDNAEQILNEDGSVEFILKEEIEEEFILDGEDHYINIAEFLSDAALLEISNEVIEAYESDNIAREPWLETVAKGLKLTGLNLGDSAATQFKGQCTAHHPLIIESAVKFQAKESPQLLNTKGPVEVLPLGAQTEESNDMASRVKNYMNYQILEEMPEYFSNTERMLLYVPLIGSGFKKTYYSDHCQRPTSEFVGADQVIVPYQATDIVSAERITHLMEITEYELKRSMNSGLYRDLGDEIEDTIGKPAQVERSVLRKAIDDLLGFSQGEIDEGYQIIEQHAYLELPEDYQEQSQNGLPLPYVVTIDVASGTVLSLRRNWEETDTKRERKQCFTHNVYVPGMGFYGLGLIHLLGNFQATLTTIMRSLVDAGQFANLPAGFKTRGMRMTGNDGPLGFGEFKEVEMLDGDIKKSIMVVPFKEPSLTLFNMLGSLEARGQKFADSADAIVADGVNYGNVGTTVALLEESNKFATAVHRRLYEAQRQEFRIMAKLNAEYLDEITSVDIVRGVLEIKRSDFDGAISIIPSADPSSSSNTQRIHLAQTQLQAALQAPDIHDRREAYKALYLSLGLDGEEIEKLLPKEEDATPNDPLTDLQKAQDSKPIKAFEGQDHQSHIRFKQAFLQNPQFGGNPMMSHIQPPIAANIQEHIILQFKEAIDSQSPPSDVSQEQASSGVAQAQAAEQMAQQAQQIAEMEANGGLDDPKRIIAQADTFRAETQRMAEEAKVQNAQAKLDLDTKELALKEAGMALEALLAQEKNSTDMDKERLKQASDMIKQALQGATPPETL